MQNWKYDSIGNNLADKIRNSAKARILINNVVMAHSEYPFNFIVDILYNATIVKIKGEKGYYLKNYSYKGCLTKFIFLDDPNFLQAIKLTTRKNIKSI
jgi:hypothetical protein